MVSIFRWFNTGMVLTTTDACRQLFKVLSIKVSRFTIARILLKFGLKNYARPKKPRLLLRHKRERLAFARVMARMPKDAWNDVIFTDESKYNLHGPDGTKRVWRYPGSPILDHHVRKVVKFGGGSVMVWGAITHSGVGKLVFIEEKMNSELYVDILRSGLRGTIELYGYDLDQIIFQQDNDPKHLSNYTRSFLSQLCSFGMRILRWPSCSPDMNIIEHVWDDVDKRVRQSLPQTPNMNDLKSIIEEEWYKTDPVYIKASY